MPPEYEVKQIYTCRFCGGKSKKCYSCKGTGTLLEAPAQPVSVVTWDTEVSEAPCDVTFMVLIKGANNQIYTDFGYRNSESADNLWIVAEDEFWPHDRRIDFKTAGTHRIVWAYAEVPDPSPEILDVISGMALHAL